MLEIKKPTLDKNDKSSRSEMKAILEALNRTQAVIQFNAEGIILDANPNFLNALGYSLSEIVGRHHCIFVESGFEYSQEYKQFWSDLRQGKPQVKEFKRIDKWGCEMWVQGSYDPIFDNEGKVTKIIQYATDITNKVLKKANSISQLDAIN
jgi:methyl-accepting chemotaxis protein